MMSSNIVYRSLRRVTICWCKSNLGQTIDKQFYGFAIDTTNLCLVILCYIVFIYIIWYWQYIYLIRRLTSQYGWVFLRVGSILYDCFLLTFIKSLLFFIHTKIARCCLICWNSLRCFHTARKPVRLFVTVIGCSWARASPHFPAFFGRARTYMQTLLPLSVYWWNEPFSWTAFGLVNFFSQLFLEK